jgi:hypothetical protein
VSQDCRPPGRDRKDQGAALGSARFLAIYNRVANCSIVLPFILQCLTWKPALMILNVLFSYVVNTERRMPSKIAALYTRSLRPCTRTYTWRSRSGYVSRRSVVCATPKRTGVKLLSCTVYQQYRARKTEEVLQETLHRLGELRWTEENRSKSGSNFINLTN